MDNLDVTIVMISLAAVLFHPPMHYPHLWSLIISILSCTAFVFCLITSILIQFDFKDHIIQYIAEIK